MRSDGTVKKCQKDAAVTHRSCTAHFARRCLGAKSRDGLAETGARRAHGSGTGVTEPPSRLVMREHNCSTASSEKIELFNKAAEEGV